VTEGQGASWEDEEAWPADGEVRVWTWVPKPLYRKWSTGPDEHGVMLGYEPTNPVWVEERRSPPGASEYGDPDDRFNPAMGGREAFVEDSYFMSDTSVYLTCPE
jgi:hypothetical protein